MEKLQVFNNSHPYVNFCYKMAKNYMFYGRVLPTCFKLSQKFSFEEEISLNKFNKRLKLIANKFRPFSLSLS
jgi:hypothetical protein